MDGCTLCPRRCKADRAQRPGFCGEGEQVRIARAAPHMWEEPCISGSGGSGTVFFSGCSLRCVFCQNRVISGGGTGRLLDVSQLADVYLSLADKGVHNINLVTPTHFTPQIAKSIELARSRGLELPFVWNSSGYEEVEALKALDGLIDVYLPDFKYASPRTAKKYSNAPDYPDVARRAVAEMKRQQRTDVFENGLLKKGVLIRHLVLPGCVEDSLDVLDIIRRDFGARQLVSVMSQYTPVGDGLPDELGRPVSSDEYDRVTGYAMLIGLCSGYFQEGDSVSESFIPDFMQEQ